LSFGGSESDPTLGGLVELQALLVDGDMVVVPAEEDEIVLVGGPVVSDPVVVVVGLEPVAALAAVYGTDPVVVVL
jgi:hypothetical protein